MTPEISGIHHVTAICRDPERNVRFYTNVLGLRMVKLTVNHDAPTVYHLYYADDVGTPGATLTFFPWPRAPRGHQGVGQATVVSLAIRPTSLGYWAERLIHQGVDFEGPRRALDETRIAFRDPDGLMLELVAHPDAERRPYWGDGPVPADHAIRGIHGVTLWEDAIGATDELLTETLGFWPVTQRQSIRRYALGEGRSGQLLDVREAPDFWEGRVAPGAVHHVAWRTPDEREHQAWQETIAELGYHVTPVIDRHYFRSIYFREPGGVLFEIATDPPGFTIDEPARSLGSSLVLPPWLREDRERIERLLPTPPSRLVQLASHATDAVAATDPQAHMNASLGFIHRYVPPSKGQRTTLLLLHGTGGSEDDLLPLGEQLMSGAALLSPRGQVDEDGMARFLSRREPGVVDRADLRRRTDALADFVASASAEYGFDAGRVVAVGYSNGANMVSSLLLRHPRTLTGAALIHPVVPVEPETLPDLRATSVLVVVGANDESVPEGEPERLARMLRDAGADVELSRHPGAMRSIKRRLSGHGPGYSDTGLSPAESIPLVRRFRAP